MNDMKKRIAQVFRVIRSYKNLSQEEMAKNLGVSLRVYHYFENGKGDYNVNRLNAFAAKFGISIQDLMEGRFLIGSSLIK